MHSYAQELQRTQCLSVELSIRLRAWSRPFACLATPLVGVALPCSLNGQDTTARGNGKTPKIVTDGDGSNMTPFAKGLGQTAGNKIKKTGCGADKTPKKPERGLPLKGGVPA